MSYEDEEYKAAMQGDGQDWRSGLQKTNGGAIKPTITNVYLAVKWEIHGNQWLAFDQFLGEAVVTGETPWARDSEGRTWSDQDTLQARLRLNSLYGVDFGSQLVHDAVEAVARDNSFHPVRKYLQALRWDGVPRLDTWLHRYLGADETKGGDCRLYLKLAGAWWMIGAVARVMKPGCRMDNVLIFEGKQGAYKSTALSILAGEWFLDTPIVIGDKDGYQALRGKWIIELAELDSLNKAESTKAKAFFSSPKDSFRPSYGRRPVDCPRQCVFGGTTNEDSYMRDGTGNRRYWPVEIDSIRIKELTRDRDQLWAEAFARFNAGERWWPEGDDRDEFEAQQALRLIPDPWEAAIGDWLAQPEVALRCRTRGVTTFEVLRHACKVEEGRMDERSQQMRVAKALRGLGLKKRESKLARETGSRYVYVLVEDEKVGTGRDRDVF